MLSSSKGSLRLLAMLLQLLFIGLELGNPVLNLRALAHATPSPTPLRLPPLAIIALVLELAVHVVLEGLLLRLERVAALAPLARDL